MTGSDSRRPWHNGSLRSNEDLYAVGYFRSHTREGFALDNNDTELFREFFRDPLDIAVLIKAVCDAHGDGWFFSPGTRRACCG